ncbi:MAG: type II toxin-antitoxin system VapC family toxin [Cyanobacteria bacterium]|nr:type II toxin-antitoxin system VapC family toxin [Cyanobacteriota bacterium]MDA0864898.1 type II toxin-antitoxin system VapC family toxin [Cyanobacteriota bacterium]
MSGNRYVLDTNAIVALLQGNLAVAQLLQGAEWIGISVISQIEFLVFSGLTAGDKALFQQFLERVEVINLASDNTALIDTIIALRQQHRIKLPDAIIGAITLHNSASLITTDQAFAKITDLAATTWEVS